MCNEKISKYVTCLLRGCQWLHTGPSIHRIKKATIFSFAGYQLKLNVTLSCNFLIVRIEPRGNWIKLNKVVVTYNLKLKKEIQNTSHEISSARRHFGNYEADIESHSNLRNTFTSEEISQLMSPKQYICKTYVCTSDNFSAWLQRLRYLLKPLGADRFVLGLTENKISISYV